MTLDFLRIADGYLPLHYPRIPYHQTDRFFTGERADGQDPQKATLWHELTRGRLRGLWRNHDTHEYNTEIPHPFILPGLAYLLSGGSIAAVALAPQLYLAILLLSVFGIARRLADPWVGLAAAAIVSGYIGVFGILRTHHEIVALPALSLALIYFLFRSDGFRNLGSVLAAGLMAWLAMRSGESVSRVLLVGLVVAFPFLYAVKRLIVAGRADRGAAIRGASGLALLLVMVTCAFEWTRLASMFVSTIQSWTDVESPAVIDQDNSPSFAALLWYLAYPIDIAFRAVGPAMSLWFLVSVVLFFRRPVDARRLAVGLTFLAPLILFSLINRKSSYYLYPVLPIMALVTALGLERIKRPRFRGFALGLASLCGIAVLCFYSLASNEWLKRVDPDHICPNISRAVWIYSDDLLRFNFYQQEASLAESAARLVEHVQLNPPPAGEVRVMAILATDNRLVDALRYVVELREPRIFLINLLHGELYENRKLKLTQVDFDYVFFLANSGPIHWIEDADSEPAPNSFWNMEFYQKELLRNKELAETIKKLGTQRWEIIYLAGKPIYRRIGSNQRKSGLAFRYEGKKIRAANADIP